MRFDNENKIKDLYTDCVKKYFTQYTLKTPKFQATQKFDKLALIECLSVDDVTIQMSSLFDLEDKMAVNIMSHEIVHYILFSQGYKKWNKHDDKFMEIAGQLNATYGLNVSNSKNVLPTRQGTISFTLPIQKLAKKVKNLFAN